MKEKLYERLKSMTILLIEDDEDIRDALRRSFENRGCRCIAFETGEECIEKMKGNHFDIIISDYLLAEINGIELIRRLGNSHPGAGKILITAYGNERLFVEAAEAGADEIIDKPFTMGILEESIFRVLRWREAADSNNSRLGRFEEK